MLRVVIVLLVLGAAAALLLLWRADSPNHGGTGKHPTLDQHSSSAEPAAPPPASAASPSREEVRAAAHEDQMASSEGETARSPAKPGRQGHVVVLDQDRREHSRESGSIALEVHVNGDENDATMSVDAGTFQVAAPVGATLTVLGATLGDRTAVADQSQVTVEESVQIEVRLRWLAPTLLRVVDADTGADLREVQVVKTNNWERENDQHPGEVDPTQVRVEHAASPFELQAVSGPFGVELQETLHVRAPGYAWARFQLDFTTGGEHRLDLQRRAELEVTLINYESDGGNSAEANAEIEKAMARFAAASPDQFPGGTKPDEWEAREQIPRHIVDSSRSRPGNGPVICVREASHVELPTLDRLMKHFATMPDSAFESGKRPTESEVRDLLEKGTQQWRLAGDVKAERTPAEKGPTRVTDLLPGTSLVTVEIGKNLGNSLVLAEQEVELRAGETTSITLRLADRTAAQRPVPLAGTLYVPSGWSHLGPSLDFNILDRPDLGDSGKADVSFAQMQAVEGSAGLYRWSAGLVPPGRYVAKVGVLQIQSLVDVPPEGCQDVRIVIGDPADVRLRAVDEDGADTEVDTVLWCGPRAMLGGEMSLNPATYDASSKTYQFRAPAGRVVIRIWDRRFRFNNETITVEPGPNEHTVHLERSYGVILTLSDGEMKVRWPEHNYPSIESLGYKGAVAASGDDADGYYMAVSAPGRYRVKVPNIDGYEPVPPFEIDIPKAEFVTRNVALQRRR